MAENTGFLPGLSLVAGKPVLAALDGGRLTSDAGVLVLAEIDRRLGICERSGALHRGPTCARAHPPPARRDDPLPRAAGRRRLCRCQRLRRAAYRPGVQDGGRPAAREPHRSVLPADHEESFDDMAGRVAATCAAIERGDAVEEVHHVNFESWDLLTSVLTPKRVELLRHLHRSPATSILALSKALGRDYKSVHGDVKALAEAGLIDQTEKGLRAEYDEIRTTLAL